MKALKTLFEVLLATAMVFGFAPFSDADDDDSDPAVAATYTATLASSFYTIYFYAGTDGEDNWKQIFTNSSITKDYATGTYSAYPNATWKNGQYAFSTKKKIGISGSLVDANVGAPEIITIEDGSFTLNGSEYTLKK